MILLAPLTAQRMPDGLSLWPAMGLRPASITPEPASKPSDFLMSPSKLNFPEKTMGYERRMPQLQLPVFPAGVTEIISLVAVKTEADTVW